MLTPNLSKRNYVKTEFKQENEILLNQMYGVPISIRVFTHMLGFQVDIKKLLANCCSGVPIKISGSKNCSLLKNSLNKDWKTITQIRMVQTMVLAVIDQSRFAVRIGKKSPNQETGLGNRGHLKVLFDTKLVLNEHERQT